MRKIEDIVTSSGGSTLSQAQKQDLKKYTIDEKTAICYDANLKTSKLSVIVAGYKATANGYKFEFTNYPFYRLVYTFSGNALLKYKSKKYDVENGSLYGFAPNESGLILNQTDAPWVHYYIHFMGKEAKKLFEQIGFVSQRVIHITNTVETEMLFENIVNEAIRQGVYSQSICDSYLNVLLLKLFGDVVQNTNHHSISQVNYLKCRDYINKHFSEIYSIQQIADNCFISKVHLCRLFREHAHTSPMLYVTKLKMNKAALLLIQSDYLIKQISHSLNFENQYYFSRTFKSFYGVSPTIYRKNQQKNMRDS